ncbi:MAG: alpha/beta hydrolase [Clostridia bacterium]|nr:alpha/beta hydrolase [Clostridia bacterium]
MSNRIISVAVIGALFLGLLFGIGATVPEKSIKYRDLAYGTHERQTLDLNIPTDNDGEIGLVLFIHGGGWIAGDKSGYERSLADVSDIFGFAAAAMNYRYVSESSDLGDIMDDIDAALALIRQKGEENGVSINKVLLTGGSAGGHLSLLYGYSRVDGAPIKPVAVVDNCGLSDLNDENYYIENGLGTDEQIALLFSWAIGESFTYEERAEKYELLEKYSPNYYINENTVPTVINHGMKDNVVPYSNALSLDAKLTEYGVVHYLNAYPNSGHGLDADEENQKTATELFYSYCETYLN